MAPDPEPIQHVTRLLEAAREGEAGAQDRLIEALYSELRSIARRHMRHERVGHTLQPTGLVNEVALRLLGRQPMRFEDRDHFLRAASLAMRRVLVDHARARRAAKRDGGVRVTLHDEAIGSPESVDVLDLDRALERLAAAEPRWARVVELRFVLGLEVTEVAEVLGVSEPTVKRDWRFARAWLARELDEGGARDGD
jgi:RNA polymerase sigma-70 factor, ECF subfamily